MTNFLLDPFDIVLEAAKKIKPDIDFEAVVDPSMKYKNFLWFKYGACGCTVFPYDGSKPTVYISSNIPYTAMVETYAHELAHVIAGPSSNHDKSWESVFDQLYELYNDLITNKISELKGGE